MPLLEELRNAAKVLDPQFQPSSNEALSILGALVHYAEHGPKFLQAAEGGVEDVVNLLAPPAPDPASTSAPAQDQELTKRIADLEAQLAARQATEQQTAVTHEPGAGGVSAAGFLGRFGHQGT